MGGMSAEETEYPGRDVLMDAMDGLADSVGVGYARTGGVASGVDPEECDVLAIVGDWRGDDVGKSSRHISRGGKRGVVA